MPEINARVDSGCVLWAIRFPVSMSSLHSFRFSILFSTFPNVHRIDFTFSFSSDKLKRIRDLSFTPLSQRIVYSYKKINSISRQSRLSISADRAINKINLTSTIGCEIKNDWEIFRESRIRYAFSLSVLLQLCFRFAAKSLVNATAVQAYKSEEKISTSIIDSHLIYARKLIHCIE